MTVFQILSNNLATTTTRRSKKKARAVTFDKATTVYEIDRVTRKQDVWFSRRDEYDFRQRNFKMGTLLQCMDYFELEIKSGDSPRGLEHTTTEIRQAMQQRREHSVNAVLDIQELCRDTGWEDADECIAQAYRAVCYQAMQSALQRAALDEKFVKDHVIFKWSTNRVFEMRCPRPSVMGRQPARRSLATA